MNSKAYNEFLRSLSPWEFLVLVQTRDQIVRPWKQKCITIEIIRRKLTQ